MLRWTALPVIAAIALAPGGTALAGDPTNWDLQHMQDRYYVELVGGLALPMPAFGGVDVIDNCGNCGVGAGGYILGRFGYRYRSGFMFGAEAGYLRTGDGSWDRPTPLYFQGRPPDTGTVNDGLLLQGGLIGAVVGFRLPVALVITPELGTGLFVGTMADHISGSFCAAGMMACDQQYSISVGEIGWPTSFYLRPSLRVGVQFGPHVEVFTEIEALFLFTTGRPTWTPGAGKVTTPDGVGTLPSFSLTGTAYMVLQSTAGIRYEL